MNPRSETSLNSATPKLLPPGHPLPWSQRVVLRLVGKFVAPRARTRRDESRTTGVRFHEKIAALAATIPPTEREKRVLVPTQSGLEDSSRFWSVNELLEHVTLVDLGIRGLIVTLAEGKQSKLAVTTAGVKPGHHAADAAAPEAELARFQDLVANLFTDLDLELAQPQRNFASTVTAGHPWFGELRASEWYWVLGMHASVHYKQLKAIVRGLRGEERN